MAKNNKKKKNNATTPKQAFTAEKYIRRCARKLPLGKCYIGRGWEERGICDVVVTRTHRNGDILFGAFLVDTFCLGVKDVAYRDEYPQDDFDEDILERIFSSTGYDECPYEDAHNLIYSAIEFAEEAGIEPDKTFTEVGQYILEEDNDDIPLKEFPMGRDGKYILIEGPTGRERKYRKTLQQRLGDRFEYIMSADGFFDDDEGEDVCGDNEGGTCGNKDIRPDDEDAYFKMLEISENISKTAPKHPGVQDK